MFVHLGQQIALRSPTTSFLANILFFHKGTQQIKGRERQLLEKV